MSNERQGDRKAEGKPKPQQGSEYCGNVSGGDTSRHQLSGDRLGRQTAVKETAAVSSTPTASLGGSGGGSHEAVSHCIKESSSRDTEELECL